MPARAFIRGMRSLVIAAIALATLLPASARADDDNDALMKRRTELVSAIAKRDVAAVKARVTLPLRLRYMRFAGDTCEPFWGETVEVDEAKLEAFVTCVADAGIKALTGPDDRWVAAVYGPGMPLVFVFAADNTVKSLYSYSKPGTEALIIEPVTFTSHITKFNRAVAPPAKRKKSIDKSKDESVHAAITVCVKPDGKVEALAEGALDEEYAKHATTVAQKWKIKPFKLGGKAVPACSILSLGYPAKRIAGPLQMLPPPPPPPPTGGVPPGAGSSTAPQNVPPTLLEGSRIAGDKVIVPDDATKTEITRAGKEKIIGSFKLCIDATGAVMTVKMLKTTGFADYDAKIIREMNKWAYKPFIVNGKSTPVCTAVTFIYSQR
jgi:hypothetical protein